ncbi:serine/threonine-protein kinase [Umezawaea sp. Da 62-37]|uniref:serine/threonine-protein kinase n=1 Tax=Umezawaea sp. Da 62-37 TaxID=3075927 RepID=UPI0028F6D7D7|nr:serine/threonine-protein kinase [Umezawaea sp. Da 62-37]WNV85202.1 serine/threonine-protein kinase [Umezawaea sp. Da 62-37]
MPLSVNDELLADRYELAEVIGIGGMAEVYRAWDTRLRRPVAIKVFTADADPDNARRFDNEVHILAGLSHPGLVSVYDVGTAGRTPFVVLRLVDGHTLRRRMALGPLTTDQVRSLGAAVADALAYVHGRGVMHRDVKPSNILLDDDTPYLADFGLAHSVGSTRLTRTGRVVGTAAYLAPEQVRGAEVDSAADVYALGLVLLECLTGRCEYTGSDVEAMVARLHRSPVIPEHLPAGLARLLALMTSPSPEQRPTAGDCATVLRAGELTTEPIPEPIPEPEPKPEPEPSPRRPWPHRKASAVFAAGLLGAVGVGWAITAGTTAPAPESPAAVHPAITSTTPAPTTTTQPVANPDTVSATTQQPPDDTNHPAPAPEPSPDGGSVESPEQDQPPGADKKDKQIPPGQAKKNKP